MNTRVYDALVNADGNRTGSAAMSIIDSLQKYLEDDKGVQVAGLAIAFLLFCERFGLSPQDVFTASKNILNTSQGARAKDFQAVRDYLANEVHA